jgi:predicted transcriptional regulator
MTSATTLKLPQSLKTRIVAAARGLDKTPHAFMIEALAVQTERAECRRQFVAAAIAAEQDVAKHRLVHDANDVFAWMRGKLAGKSPTRPRARKTGKYA